MTKKEFIIKTVFTPCEDCNIHVFCSVCRAISCAQVASRYYRTHTNEKGEFKCPEKDLRKTE